MRSSSLPKDDPGRIVVVALAGAALLAQFTACAAQRVPEASRPGASGVTGSSARPSPTAGGITLEDDRQIPPGPPGTVHVSHHDSLHTVTWAGTRDDTILGYQVYRRCPHEGWQAVGSLGLLAGDERNQGAYSFQDTFVLRCEYTVAAIGRDGKPGPMTVEIQ